MVSYTQYHELSDSCVLTGDNLAYLFPVLQGLFRPMEADDLKFSHRMIELLTTFAKEGKPRINMALQVEGGGPPEHLPPQHRQPDGHGGGSAQPPAGVLLADDAGVLELQQRELQASPPSSPCPSRRGAVGPPSVINCSVKCKVTNRVVKCSNHN